MPLGVADLNTTPEANDAYGNSGAMDDTGSDDLVRRTARCGGKGMERFLPQSVTSTWCGLGRIVRRIRHTAGPLSVTP
jgi:hypothetical protein